MNNSRKKTDDMADASIYQVKSAVINDETIDKK